MTSIWNWLFVQQVDYVPPVCAGLALMAGLVILLLGWRISRMVAVLDFSIMGAILGALLAAGMPLQWLSAAAGAVGFGLLGLWIRRYCEVVAGGFAAAIAVVLLMQWLHSPLLASLLATGTAFCCAVAMGLVAERHATAVVTAVQGGMLTAFGLASCLANSQAIWPEIRPLLSGSDMALAMFIVMPIGVGMLFQISAIENEGLVAQ